ncbi:MAG: hypothetical protein WD607_07725 [Candidatus Paceibacterota bacterium]
MTKRKKRKKKIANVKNSSKSKKDELYWLKKALYLFAVGTVIIIGGAALLIAGFRSGGHDVQIEILQLDENILRGVPTDIDVNIINETGSQLNNASLNVIFDSKASNLDVDGDKNSLLKNIGSISPGGLDKRSINVLPIGKAGEVSEIRATLSYSIGTTRFEEQKTFNLEINEEPINVEVNRPEQIVGGSEFEIEINYENNSDYNFNNLALEIQYPDSFNYISSNLQPENSNRWLLGGLRPNSNGSINVRGVLNGTNLTPSFNVNVITEMIGNEYVIADNSSDIEIEGSPLKIETTINGVSSHITFAGERLIYFIDYENKSGIALRDVEIIMDLSGDMFDFSTLSSSGEFDEQNKRITWNKETNPEFGFIEPGRKSRVIANINLKSSFPISRLSDKNFDLEVSSRIKSPSVPYYIEANSISAVSNLNTKVRGLTTIGAKAFFRDASSGIINSGSLPPKVGKLNEYSIHWTLKNYSTDVENVEVTASLPSGVNWIGVIESDLEEEPIYNSEEREVVWKIDNIQATKGVISLPINTVFKIEATPTEDIEGQFQSLLSRTTLTAIDEWTGVTLTSIDNPLNTALPDDKTTDEEDGVVID